LDKKLVVGAVYSLGLQGFRATPRRVAERLGAGEVETKEEMRRLAKLGYLRLEGGRAALTRKGRGSIKVVFIGGGFEVIHYGHLFTIERAKGLGDVLVVSVARDSTIRRRKSREPVAGESERVRLLSSLRQVDAAILGVEGDIYETLERVKPDVVALGYDQYHRESDIRREGAKRGMKLRVVRIGSPYPGMKTSAILREV
jgi:FAD synthetase